MTRPKFTTQRPLNCSAIVIYRIIFAHQILLSSAKRGLFLSSPHSFTDVCNENSGTNQFLNEKITFFIHIYNEEVV